MFYSLYIWFFNKKVPSNSTYWLSYFLEVILFIVMVAIYSASTQSVQSEHIIKGLINFAYIKNNEITLHLKAHRDYLPCEGASRIVRLVTYRDSAHTKIKDVRFAHETTIVDDNNLDVDEWPVYHYDGPLPGDLNDWYVFSDLHDNCPWWYDLVPNIIVRNLQKENIHSPPLHLTTSYPTEAFKDK